MTDAGARGKAFRIGRNILSICIVAAVCRYPVAFAMGTQDIYFRSWLTAALDLLTWFGIPLLAAVLLLGRYLIKKESELIKRHWGKSAAAGLLISFGVILFMVYLLAAVFVFILKADSTYEKEEMLPYGILAGSVDWNVFESAQRYRYYEDAGLFTKKECNDRIMAQTWFGAQQFWQDKADGRQLEAVTEEDGYIREVRFYGTYEELDASARETAALIAALLTDSFFAEEHHGSSIRVICGQKANGQNEWELYFGNSGGGLAAGGLPMDYYADYENVRGALAEAFDDNPHAILEYPEYHGTAAGENEEQESPEEYEKRMELEEKARIAEAEKSLLTPEGSFRKLYDTLFAGQGYDYLVYYNAKGNFYAVLEEGERQQAGEKDTTQHTVVYDRESKNGKCQLFVEYRDYLKTDGTETSVYSTDILEFYAVDMLTGEVCAGGKTAWDQVGNAKYREMTGEPI